MIALGIVAHTSRATAAHALARATAADYLSLDDGHLGCDANHQAVWRHLAGLPSSWSVILEDDAAPVEGFRDQLAAALPMAPAPIVSCYLGRQRPLGWAAKAHAAVQAAEAAGAHWIVAARLLHAVAYALPTRLLGSLLEHQSRRPVDEHISSWARRYGHTVAYTMPSLVDHSDLPTIVAHPDGAPRPPGRTAWRLGAHRTWTTRSVPLSHRTRPCSPTP